MKSRTFVIQITCVALGVAFMLLGIAVRSHVGGFLIGSLMFFAAALLGADPTTNPRPQSRRVFQAMAGASAIPFVIACVITSVELVQSSEWAALIANLFRLTVFVLAAFAVAFSEHPFIQRQLKKLGLFTPTN